MCIMAKSQDDPRICTMIRILLSYKFNGQRLIIVNRTLPVLATDLRLMECGSDVAQEILNYARTQFKASSASFRYLKDN